MCVYSKRLFKEWRKQGRIIVAVNFDDTIAPYGFLGNDRDVDRAIQVVKKARKLSAYIVIFTSAIPSRYNAIINVCKNLDIEIDSINKNPLELQVLNNDNVNYNILLDDRGGLKESLKILKKAMKMYKSYKSKHA